MAKADGEAKLQKAKVYYMLGEEINKRGIGSGYYVASPSPGIHKPLQTISREDPDIVMYVPPSAVSADVVKFCANNPYGCDQFLLTAREAEAAVAFWLYNTPAVPVPRAFAWPGETGLAFTRLPWLPTDAKAPTWDGLLSRISNRDAFMIWVGSLFDEQSYSQHYVWMHGGGQEGKGCINRFLAKIFGPAYCSKQPRERGDKFWTHELLGKRLVVFPDMDDSNFVTSALFKSMTGGDPVPVEAKGQMAYTATLNAKYLVFSNERPNLSSDTADKRRIIYCDIASREKGAEITPDFEAKLWSEGGAFLGQCLEKYNRHGRGPIASDSEAITEWIETVEMHFSQVFDFYFVETVAKEHWLTGEQVQRTLRHPFKTRKEQLEFITWLGRAKSIKRQTVDNKTGSKRYKGLGYRPPVVIDERHPPDGRWLGQQ